MRLRVVLLGVRSTHLSLSAESVMASVPELRHAEFVVLLSESLAGCTVGDYLAGYGANDKNGSSSAERVLFIREGDNLFPSSMRTLDEAMASGADLVRSVIRNVGADLWAEGSVALTEGPPSARRDLAGLFVRGEALARCARQFAGLRTECDVFDVLVRNCGAPVLTRFPVIARIGARDGTVADSCGIGKCQSERQCCDGSLADLSRESTARIVDALLRGVDPLPPAGRCRVAFKHLRGIEPTDPRFLGLASIALWAQGRFAASNMLASIYRFGESQPRVSQDVVAWTEALDAIGDGSLRVLAPLLLPGARACMRTCIGDERWRQVARSFASAYGEHALSFLPEAQCDDAILQRSAAPEPRVVRARRRARGFAIEIRGSHATRLALMLPNSKAVVLPRSTREYSEPRSQVLESVFDIRGLPVNSRLRLVDLQHGGCKRSVWGPVDVPIYSAWSSVLLEDVDGALTVVRRKHWLLRLPRSALSRVRRARTRVATHASDSSNAP